MGMNKEELKALFGDWVVDTSEHEDIPSTKEVPEAFAKEKDEADALWAAKQRAVQQEVQEMKELIGHTTKGFFGQSEVNELDAAELVQQMLATPLDGEPFDPNNLKQIAEGWGFEVNNKKRGKNE